MAVPKHPASVPGAGGPAGAARRIAPTGARRLLVASIGAATIHYAAGCEGDELHQVVANLMAAPFVPIGGGRQPSGGRGGAGGSAGSAGMGGRAADADGGAEDAGSENDAGSSR